MRVPQGLAVRASFCLALTGTAWLGLPDWPRPVSVSGVSAPVTGAVPQPPKEMVSTSHVPSTGRTIHVPGNGDFQDALDSASPGDLITLERGATYRGPFRLRRKEGTGWIVVSSAASSELPAPGKRVDPSHAPLMPKLRASSRFVITADPGAHHYRFVGIDIAPTEGRFLYALAQLGENERDEASLPHHIIFDRCYLHGDPKMGTRRGVAMNSRHTAVIDSYLSDFKEVGADSQAIAGWNGPGPFKISNNYLEAAGENVMFGGADPSIEGLVPSDIEITRNHMVKPLRWKADHREFEGTAWTVKNLFELKNARRVLVEGNLFEHNWPAAQNGFAILFTVRNQEGGAPWSVVEDVIFKNNVVRRVAAGLNILGHDDNHRSQQTRRLLIRNNLFLEVGGAWGSGRLFQLLDGTGEITIDHNTAFQTGSVVFGGDHAPHTGFVFENNIVMHGKNGITASGTKSGQETLDKYFPGAVVRRNLIVGGGPSEYPADNFFPATLQEVGFTQLPDGSYRLALASRYARSGSDGRSPGADLHAITGAATLISTTAQAGRADSRPSLAGVVALSLNAPGSWQEAATLVFWGSLFLLIYVYIGYPLLAWLRAALFPRKRARAPIEPTVSMIVVAHNEEVRIGARIGNLLALNYPRDRLEILVGSDGSTDDTVREASQFGEHGVRVLSFADRRGKPAVLNDLVPLTTGEIVLFADARQRFDAGVVRSLVSHFADQTVGAVSGELMLEGDVGGSAAARGTSFYWRYEKFIRSRESRAASTVGATGAVYAIRRELFAPMPPDTILDDVLIPLRIVRRGYSVLFDPDAKAYDRVSETAQREYSRKVRTIAGTFQLFAREAWLLNPVQNPLWFETVSHKGLRLTLPLLHVVLLGASMALADGSLYRAALAAQLCFYAAALAGHLFGRARRRPIWLAVPYAICLLSWATVAGFIRFITARQPVTWDRAAPPLISLSSSRSRSSR